MSDAHPLPSRRRFGRTIASAALGAYAFPAVVSGRNLNEKLNVAIIGSGGRGADNLRDVSSETITVLCDVYEPHLETAASLHPKARRERDFRRVFDRAGEFDAVVVSTTEHTHAFATLPALRLGKHVYCEKPLTHDVHEARVVREAFAKTKGVATQMGTQVHASDNYRRVVELVQSGAIGKVSEAHVWVSRAWGRQSPEAAERNRDIVTVLERPKEATSPPTGLDWDLWLGPAPERPFHEVYLPGPKWYRWWDFGNGTMSDLGSHAVDLSFWALKLRAPSRIEPFGPPPHPELAPASMHVRYDYQADGEQPALSLTWYQGEDKPKPWTEGAIPKWSNGTLFVGDQGMLLADYDRHVLLPEDHFKDFNRPEPSIPKSLGHHAEWIHAAKTGGATTCNFEYAGWLTEANHLGNVAHRAGKAIAWDAQAMRTPDAPEVEPFIRREYRQGWAL